MNAIQPISSLLQQESIHICLDRKYGRLRLPFSTTPQLRLCKDRHRCINEVDSRLRTTMRRVIQGHEPWPLVILGPAGVGKTRAALCAADYVKGSTWFFTFSDLCRKLIEAQNGELENDRGYRITTASIWRDAKEVCLYILDDLGTMRSTDHRMDTIKHLLELRENKALIVTSNMNVEEIAAHYDDRIASRLAGGTVFWLDGPDRRLQ